MEMQMLLVYLRGRYWHLLSRKTIILRRQFQVQLVQPTTIQEVKAPSRKLLLASWILALFSTSTKERTMKSPYSTPEQKPLTRSRPLTTKQLKKKKLEGLIWLRVALILQLRFQQNLADQVLQQHTITLILIWLVLLNLLSGQQQLLISVLQPSPSKEHHSVRLLQLTVDPTDCLGCRSLQIQPRLMFP